MACTGYVYYYSLLRSFCSHKTQENIETPITSMMVLRGYSLGFGLGGLTFRGHVAEALAMYSVAGHAMSGLRGQKLGQVVSLLRKLP